MTIDPGTNLPTLPENFFWSLKRDWDRSVDNYPWGKANGLLLLELKRRESVINLRKEGFFKKKVIEIPTERVTTLFKDTCNPNDKDIRTTAQKLLDEYETYVTVESYVGEYPPKKLES